MTAMETQLRATLRAAQDHATDCPRCTRPTPVRRWARCTTGRALAASLRTLAGSR